MTSRSPTQMGMGTCSLTSLRASWFSGGTGSSSQPMSNSAEGFSNSDRRRHIVASVEVDEEFDVRADSVADSAGDLDALSQTGRRDVVTMLQRRYIVELPEGVHLEGRVTLGDRLKSGLRISLRRRPPIEPAVGVQTQIISEPTPQKFINRQSQCRLPFKSHNAISTAEISADPNPRFPVLLSSEKSRVQM